MIDALKTLFFTPNKMIADAALRLAQIHDALTHGELTESEYRELIDDAQRLVAVTDFAEDLKTKIIIRESIDTIVMLAAKLPKGV